MALSPISLTVPWKDFVGDGVDSHVSGLAEMHIDDVGFIHLDLGCDDGHVGERHQRAAGGILNSHDHSLAFADRKIGDHAIEGRFVGGFLQHIGNPSKVGLILRDVLVHRILLRLGLGYFRFGLRQSGLSGLPCSFLDVVILFGDESRVV